MLCTAAAAAGCHRDNQPAPPPKPASNVAVPVAPQKGPTVAEQTAGMVEAASQGKSQLPIDLKFELPQRPTLGQALAVNVALVPQIDASAGAIEVAGGDGLSIAPGANRIDLPALESGHVYRHSVSVTPHAEGVLLLGLTLTLKHDEIVESRSFSIPLIVER
jgi:hypothetical protein